MACHKGNLRLLLLIIIFDKFIPLTLFNLFLIMPLLCHNHFYVHRHNKSWNNPHLPHKYPFLLGQISQKKPGLVLSTILYACLILLKESILRTSANLSEEFPTNTSFLFQIIINSAPS